MPSLPDLQSMLADAAIQGVILTVPNEQHLPLAAQVAQAGKHVYTEKPIASTLDDGLKIEALERSTRSARRSATARGCWPARARSMRRSMPASSAALRFIEGNFSNERALELTPTDWRWYKG